MKKGRENYNSTSKNYSMVKDDKISPIGNIKEQIPEIKGVHLKSISDIRRESGIKITLSQFGTFIKSTESQKLDIVKNQINQKAPEETYFWYRGAYGYIQRSLRNSNRELIFKGLEQFKNRVPRPDKKNDPANISGSILALENYSSLQFPEPFNSLTKEKIKAAIKSHLIDGVQISINPDYVFRSYHNGKKVLGCAKVLIRNGNKLDSEQRRVIAFILYDHLVKNIAQEDEVVLPELCLFIDVAHRIITASPGRNEAPRVTIKNGLDDLVQYWDNVKH